MDFNDILDLPDKAIVPELRGRIIKIYDPKNPTPAQDRAGIYPQTIVLQDDAGTNLDLYLMRKELHFLPSERDEIYHFRCTDNDRGDPAGLSVNRWKGNNGEQFCIQVDKQSHRYPVEQSPAERKIFEESKPVVGDLIVHYCEIIIGVETRLAGSEVGAAFLNHPECLTSAAATIFIESCKQGMYHKPKVQTAPVESKPVAAQKSNDPAPRNDAVPQSYPDPGPTVAELALMITSGFTGEQIRAVFETLPDKPDYARIYDEIGMLLESEGYTRNVIDAAHDRVRGLLQKKVEKKLTDNQLYKSICCNFASFREQLPKLRTEPKETGLDNDDDSGLPSLDD